MIKIKACIFIFLLGFANLCAQSSDRNPAKRPTPGTLFMFPERIQLTEGGFFTAERGVTFVPLNRSKPDSDVISIEIYRFPRSQKADPNTPPIFYLPGGPGFEGMQENLERGGLFESRWRPFLDISDLIIISQRGIGSSMPRTIIETKSSQQPLDQPFDDEKAAQIYRKQLQLEKEFWQEQGLDLSGLNVIEAAGDIDDVRQALGYENLIIWGGSFGSHWGMTYMRFFPERVARAILFGLEGPDQSYDRPSHYWNVYKRVAVEAEKTQVLKSSIPEGGLIKAYENIIKKVKAKPFTVNIELDSISQKILFDDQTVIHYLSSVDLGDWPSRVIQLHEGHYQAIAEEIYANWKRRADRRRNSTASFWMLDCGSGISPQRLAEYESDPSRWLTGHTYWIYDVGCELWPSDLGNKFRKNFETDIPTLLVQGDWDIYTPYENALELAPFFKKGKLVRVVNGPHGSVMAASRASSQFKQALNHFVSTGDMSNVPSRVTVPLPSWATP